MWVAQENAAAARHLVKAADWWQEDLERGVSPFRWWWGSEAQEQQACRGPAAWLAARGAAGKRISPPL